MMIAYRSNYYLQMSCAYRPTPLAI